MPKAAGQFDAYEISHKLQGQYRAMVSHTADDAPVEDDSSNAQRCLLDITASHTSLFVGDAMMRD